MMDLLDLMLSLANHPAVRLLAIGISIVSLAVSYLAFRKTNSAIDNYWRNVTAEQERFIRQQWRDTFKLTLTNDSFAEETAKIFGHESPGAAKRDAALLLFLNICSTAYHGYRHGVLTREAMESQLTSFLGHYHGDRDALARLIALAGYDDGFRAECFKHLPAQTSPLV